MWPAGPDVDHLRADLAIVEKRPLPADLYEKVERLLHPDPTQVQ